MEDSVGVEERREQSETTPNKKARQEVVEAGGVGGGCGNPGEEGGFLSAMASKIGAAMSGANGGSGDGGGANAAVASGGGEDKEGDGNGGGGIFGKLLHSSPPAPPHASVGAMETEEVKDQDVAAEQGGILSAMATKIGMAMSGANGNGDDGHGAGSGDDSKTTNGGDYGEEKKGEEANGNGGGILSAVASKIGAAVSGANGNGNHSAEDDAKTSIGEAGHDSKGEEKGRDVNGGTIVEQIISNLPSDDQAPDADEASLLISIIED